ncbi:MAG: NAD-dependent epimerase/dehydratase family protein [Gammaproteobacteria bacterium]|nr:NAD-dependent epimerase/dehydratase family protein [Gammaproteobacteria bacterium]
MGRLLLTGASGFVGRSLLSRLGSDGIYKIRVLSRRAISDLPGCIEAVIVDGIGPATEYHNALAGIEVVIHAAGRAHILNEDIADPITAYREVNVNATLNLAEQAADLGVKRFVFISSIGVNGAETNSEPFSEISSISPHSPYAISKHEAELGLRALGRSAAMEIVIIRPPLIYGPKPPGNLARLLKIVSHGWPLPFGLVRNKRTLVSLDNIVDLIVRCIDHKKAAGETFLAGDPEDVSTDELIAFLAEGMKKRVIQLPVPIEILRIGAHTLGLHTLYQQLCCSLQIDISKARTLLNWSPPVIPRDGLIAMGRWYRENVRLK